jgi:hypothetical protein
MYLLVSSTGVKQVNKRKEKSSLKQGLKKTFRARKIRSRTKFWRRVRLPSPSMARPAFGGLAMDIHAHLDAAGRSGLSLPLCGDRTNAVLQLYRHNGAKTQPDQQHKADMPLRETLYLGCSLNM